MFFLCRLTLENELFDNYGVAEQIRVAFPAASPKKRLSAFEGGVIFTEIGCHLNPDR